MNVNNLDAEYIAHVIHHELKVLKAVEFEQRVNAAVEKELAERAELKACIEVLSTLVQLQADVSPDPAPTTGIPVVGASQKQAYDPANDAGFYQAHRRFNASKHRR